MTMTRDAKEQAYLYDLFIVPGWRERFDQMVDKEISLPQPGRVLEVGCGTGGYAINLAVRLGADCEVVAIDDSPEKLEIARGKAEVQKVKRISFSQGTHTVSGQPDNRFDLVLADASMHDPAQMEAVFAELVRVAKPGAAVAVRLTTRGSFDEFFSFYWQALYELELTDHTAQLEALINERLLVGDAEELAKQAGLKKVRSVTHKEQFDYENAATFFAAPLIESSFLAHWLAILPGAVDADRVRQQMISLIDSERGDLTFDVSIKATLIIGQK